MNKEKLSPDSVSIEYQAGIDFKAGIDLYDCVKNNENFFIGKQWEGVEANGLPTPVFNFLKRVVLFAVANVSTDNLRLKAQSLNTASVDGAWMEQMMDVLNAQFESIFEHNNIGAVIREYTRNSAVDGDGCTYTYWDPAEETGQESKGAIKTEVLLNTQVHFGNPNVRSVQDQPYILIERRMMVAEAKKRAKAAGATQENIDAITANDKSAGDLKMDKLGGDKVTVLLRLWKDDETGTVWGYECTQAAEMRKPWDLGIRRYPITWMPWDYVQDCCHGQAMITGLIPNQIFVNKLFAMSMLSLMTLAYPKVIFDKTRVEKWTNRVGAAIAVSGPVDGVAKNMDPPVISPQISQFIDLAVSYTQKFLGASDAALGDTRPDNTSAIIALQRAASTPMELTKQDLFKSIEDLGRIYMDFMGAYYGTRMVVIKGEDGKYSGNTPVDFSVLQEIPFSVKLDVGASSYWSEIASMQTLDNLLMQGKISTVEYLKRIPAGQISDRESLIQALEMEQSMMNGMQPLPGPPEEAAAPPVTDEIPLRGGAGYSALQRAINQTGEVPEVEG